jgi:hypothetical protein
MSDMRKEFQRDRDGGLLLERLPAASEVQAKRCWQQRDQDTLYLSRDGFCDCWKAGVLNLCRFLA